MLVALSAFGCCMAAGLLLPAAGSAATPGGLDCVASEGKISGRGSSYNAHAEAVFAKAYSEDFCGSVAEQGSKDPAPTGMVAYNYPAAEEATNGTGGKAGLLAASCRTDAYAGDSLPYSETQLAEIDSAPGTFGGSKGECKLSFAPPYAPQAPNNEFPNAADIAAPIMSFPIGGSSVAVAVNFGTAKGTICTGSAVPTSLKLNAKEVSRIFGGDAATWSDSELVANNPSLTTDGCTGPITRVVRFDSAGTTEIFKAYLVRAENERSSSFFTCAIGKPWSAYTKTNTEWPGGKQKVSEGTCSTLTTASKAGGPEEIAKLKEVPGGVGYADLPDEVNQAGLVTASLENAAGTSYTSPISGSGANCSYTSVSPPAGGASDAVGLSSEEKNWANNAEPNEQNVTDRGSKYPICGLTFDLVYTGLSSTTSSAIAPLTLDQRRTLYSYFTFVLSSTAQQLLSDNYYSPLPVAWVQELREGFQENF
jgi:ABC-type phosphate transport system substrate-binding protein